jgi:hypothetical protein
MLKSCYESSRPHEKPGERRVLGFITGIVRARSSIHPPLPRSQVLDPKLSLAINHTDDLPRGAEFNAADDQGNEPDHHAENDPFHRFSSLVSGWQMPNVPTFHFAQKFQTEIRDHP